MAHAALPVPRPARDREVLPDICILETISLNSTFRSFYALEKESRVWARGPRLTDENCTVL